MDKLQKIIEEALASYNETNSAMNLVLFEDALMHVARINRILESPRGNIHSSKQRSRVSKM